MNPLLGISNREEKPNGVKQGKDGCSQRPVEFKVCEDNDGGGMSSCLGVKIVLSWSGFWRR